MFIIYEKKTGKEIRLVHSVDVAEWLASKKYVEEDPKKSSATPVVSIEHKDVKVAR